MDKFLIKTPRVPPIPLEPRAVLQSVFGLKSFRGNQEEIIGNVLENKDVLVLMQTGGGLSQQSAIHNLKANP
jgi:superfamily II DNA helicase RecQ